MREQEYRIGEILQQVPDAVGDQRGAPRSHL